MIEVLTNSLTGAGKILAILFGWAAVFVWLPLGFFLWISPGDKR